MQKRNSPLVAPALRERARKPAVPLGALLTIAILLSAGPGWAQNASGLKATPATISFTANDPGSDVAGSSSATVTFSISTHSNSTWSLKVGAASSTFSGCTTVPTSAVSVMCTSATASGGGGRGGGNTHGATAGCNVSSYTTLPSSTPGLQVAGGNEPTGGNSISFTINLDYELADSWEYIANTCPLTMTYTVTAP